MDVKADLTKFIASHDQVFMSKIPYLINACDCVDNLHILIYLLSENKIIYNNDILNNIVGCCSEELLKDGWNYWYSLVNLKERACVRSSINRLFSSPDIQSSYILNYHILNERGVKIYLRHEVLFHCLGNQMLAINYFNDITEKEKIEVYLKKSTSNVDYSKNRAALISPREKEVLKLVADGFSSKQIADRLFISSHTAISHRKNLLEKFKVKNTAQLIKRASRTIELW